MAEPSTYQPYVAPSESLPEFTFRAVVLGIILSLFFAVGNAFIGLKVGMTVSASIPASVISMGILRIFYKKVSILENNMVQTIASAGEALAAGTIFTIPTLFFLGQEITVWRTFALSILGGFLGVFLMLPMRDHFIVKEHGILLFPEGTACAEILKAGQSGAKKALLAVLGVVIGASYRFLMGCVHLWDEVVQWSLTKFQKATFSMDTTPALLGVGFIIGPRLSSTMFAGGVIGWWIVMPLIKIFAQGKMIVAPGTTAVSLMTNDDIWANYIRYIGAGGVTLGGLFGLFRILPGIMRIFTVKKKPDGLVQVEHHLRTQKDLSKQVVLIGITIVLLVTWLIPLLHLNLVATAFILVLGFCFVAVTTMTVGLVGSSSSPASGMIIMTLLITLLLFMAFGWRDTSYMLMAATVSSVVAIAICIAADTSQDLKTGFLVGATPRSQQIGMLIGTTAAACVMGITLLLLNKAYHFGSPALSAPQATLLSLLAKGLVEGNLPFQLILVGALIGLAAELMGVHALALAIGLYLPLETTTSIFLGGAVSFLVHFRSSDSGWTEKGILFASGLVAGDALMGILVALFAVLGIVDISKPAILGPIFGLIVYLALALFMVYIAYPGKSKSEL